MTASGAGWREIRPGDGTRLVLAVDFVTRGRAEAGFADLAARLACPAVVWQSRPPWPHHHAGTYAGWLAAVLPDRPVDAVLGYCVGGVHAARLAGWLADQRGAHPLLIVCDPEPASAPGMLGELTAFTGRMAALLTTGELAGLRSAGECAAASATDLQRLGAELVEVLRDGTAAAFARAGLLPTVAGELIGMFAAVMAYIADAVDFDPDREWAGATALCSAPTQWTARCGRMLEFPVPRADLLRSAEVARVTDGLLAKTPVRLAGHVVRPEP